MNNIIAASFFAPSQTGILIAIGVVGILLIALNVALWCIFHKRGERKLYDRLLQKQREVLMRQLNEMRENGVSGVAESQPAFFTNTVYVEVPAQSAEGVEQTASAETASVETEAPVEEVSETTATDSTVTETSVEETFVEAPIIAVTEEIVAEEVEAPVEETVDGQQETADEQTDVADIADVEEDLSEDNAQTSADLDVDSDDVEVVIVNGRKIRYNRSFMARIIQSTDVIKARYSELKNCLLSYNGVKSRISWKHETFRIGRNTFACIVVRGKTLCLCLATDANAFAETKYKVEDLSIRSPKAKFPCLYRLNNPLRVKYAKELIDIVLLGLGVEQVENYSEEVYKLPYQSTEMLIEEGFIKVTGDAEVEVGREEAPETVAETASVSTEEVANETPADATNEVASDELTEKVAEEPTAKASEEAAVEAVENVTAEEVVEESEDEVEIEVLPERDFEILAEVDVSGVDVISDSDAEQLVEVKVVKKQRVSRKNNGIVNIDTLSRNYKAGAHVTIDNLHKKGLVAKEIKMIKVLANGVLDKPLVVEADDFSLEAVKMIVLTGGRVIRKKKSE